MPNKKLPEDEAFEDIISLRISKELDEMIKYILAVDPVFTGRSHLIRSLIIQRFRFLKSMEPKRRGF